MDIQEAITGIKSFFDGEYFAIIDTAYISEIAEEKMQRQEGEDCPPFDHCYVNQGGGGMSGDDFHGTVYFHIKDQQYIVADY